MEKLKNNLSYVGQPNLTQVHQKKNYCFNFIYIYIYIYIMLY